MKKVFPIALLLSLSACTTFAPPRPPCCDDSVEGMRPINPDMISAEEMAAWENEKAVAEAKRLSQAEELNNVQEN